MDDRKKLLLYRFEEKEPLLEKMTAALEAAGNEGKSPQDLQAAGEALYAALAMLIREAGSRGFYGNLWHCHLTHLLVSHENAYSMACEIRGPVGGTLEKAALHDISLFREWFFADLDSLAADLGVPDLLLATGFEAACSGSRTYNSRIRDRILELTEAFERSESPEEMLDALTAFYKEYGVGRFGLHKAFRVAEEGGRPQIVPIPRIMHVSLDDLVGYEAAKQKLIENTEAFVEGRPANNCLLFGDAGTGKSSSIKAIANRYYDRGLRIIEIYRHQFRYLNDIIGTIKDRNYRFIIYMDDLSFEEFETEYKYLKAVIEGGLEKKPDNVLIYATSNRRHLVRESFRDREDPLDKHGGDTVQEKLSLAGRFGLSIYFGRPEFDEFQHIVAELAARSGIEMDPRELSRQATAWQMRHGGLSGRTARQFIDHLLGTGTGTDRN